MEYNLSSMSKRNPISLGDTALLIFVLSSLAVVFGVNYERSYLGNFEIDSSTADLFVRVGVMNYLRLISPLIVLLFGIIVIFDKKFMDKFHEYFSREGTNKKRSIVTLVVILTVLAAAVFIPKITDSSIIQYFSLWLLAAVYVIMMLELWFYKKNPFQMFQNKTSAIEGIGILLINVYVPLTAASGIGASWGYFDASQTTSFNTFNFGGVNQAIIRRYDDYLVTQKYDVDKLIDTSSIRLVDIGLLSESEVRMETLKQP